MSVRDNVLRVLNGEQPAKIPWLADLDYWIKALVRDRTLPEAYQGDGLYQLHRDLGAGFYLQGYFPFTPVYEGVRVTETEDAWWRVIHVSTPVGDLRSVRKYCPDSYSWGFQEHLIKDWRDLEVLRYLYAHTFFEPNYELAEARYELIGDNGVVVVYTPRTPLMQLVAMDAGIQGVVGCIVDAPEEFDHTMAVLEAKWDEAAAITVASPAEIIEFPENLSSEVVGKRLYNRYVRHIHQRWNEEIKAAGKYPAIHFDGTLRGLLREVAATGFSILEAVTPAPVGDIALEDMPAWVQPDTVLWGGIPGGYFSDIQMTDSEFETYVIAVLEVIKQQPSRHVLAVSDQIVPGARWDRIKRVGELVEEYGRSLG